MGSSDFDAAGLALALKGQRDRFRARMLVLEAEVQTVSKELSEASARCSKLTGDNVKLYEKIRFLQFMSSGGASAEAGGSDRSELRSRQPAAAAGGGGGGAGSAAAAAAAASALAGEDDVDSTYKDLYQASLDPFAEYKHGEKARQYAALRRTDKIVLKGTALFMTSRYTRKFLFLYAIALHLFVVWMFWHMLHTEHDCAAPAAGSSAHHLRGLSGD
jgi:homeobox protein cut-like